MNWNFRPLWDNETAILIVRHGDHKGNILTPESVDMCLATGKALKEAGIEIDEACSSPAGRALETVLKILQGYGTMVYIRTDDRLADMAIEPGNTLAEATAAAKELSLPGEEGLAVVLFDPNGKFVEMMTRRSEEGADCLREIAMKNPGKTILVPTHGVARIENTLMALRGEELHQLEKLVQKCQIVEVILNSGTGELVEENWLEPVTVPAT